MGNRLTFLVAFAAVLIFTTTASAQDCGKGRKILKEVQGAVEKVADEVGCSYLNAQVGVPKPVCKQGAKVVHKLEKKLNAAMRKFWRKMVKGSWATIGPRKLVYGKKEKGTLLAVGGRMFIASRPTGKESVTVTVKKTDGRGKAGVAVCVQDLGDKSFKVVKKHMFKKGKKKGTFKYTVKNAFGKIVMVHMKGKSVAKKFKYTVVAK
jgi:hypothetical protein